MKLFFLFDFVVFLINPGFYIKYYLALEINFLGLPAVVSEHGVDPIKVRRDSVVGSGEGRVACRVHAADHP